MSLLAFLAMLFVVGVTITAALPLSTVDVTQPWTLGLVMVTAGLVGYVLARSGIGISVADFINPFVGVGGTLNNPKLALDPTSSALEGGIAYATGGMSIVAKSLFRRWFGAKDPCLELATKARELRKQRGEKAG